jgi:hypothetical protein
MTTYTIYSKHGVYERNVSEERVLEIAAIDDAAAAIEYEGWCGVWSDDNPLVIVSSSDTSPAFGADAVAFLRGGRD